VKHATAQKLFQNIIWLLNIAMYISAYKSWNSTKTTTMTTVMMVMMMMIIQFLIY